MEGASIDVKASADGKGGGKVNWQQVMIAVLGGAAVATGGMLYFQWRHASLGRKLSGDVIDFLKRHGAVVDGVTISGGPVTVPMKVDDAVINTIDTILRDITHRSQPKPAGGKQPSSGSPVRREQQEAAAAADEGATAQEQQQPSARSKSRHRRGSPVMDDGSQQQQQQQGGECQRAFPELPISGRTGMPVSAGDSGGRSPMGAPPDDYTYTPPMPPGMTPPGNQ